MLQSFHVAELPHCPCSPTCLPTAARQPEEGTTETMKRVLHPKDQLARGLKCISLLFQVRAPQQGQTVAPTLERPACARDTMERAQSPNFKCQVQVHLLVLTSCDLLGKSLKFLESWTFFWSIEWQEGPLSPRLLYGFSGGSVHTSALQTVLLLLSIIAMAFPPKRRTFFLCRGFPFWLQRNIFDATPIKF